MEFLKDNWFKVGILMFLLATVVTSGFYAIQKNNLEKERFAQELWKDRQKQEQEDATKALVEDKARASKEQAIATQQQKEAQQAVINKCLTDAYTELKTLQHNFDWLYFESCKKSSSATGCDSDWNKQTKDDAFKTYENEWLPQCKLGNRVFIHYEWYQ